MKMVIQCAGSKADHAGFLKTRGGQPVKFVAHPDEAPRSGEFIFAQPDGPSDVPGKSWRDLLIECNTTAHENSFGLLEAYRLYQNQIYKELVLSLGKGNVFILSAGWGLVRSTYLLPTYDITFSQSGERYAHRGRHDEYKDFCQLQTDESGPIIFLGGKDYHLLFQQLTDPLPCKKIVFYASANPPKHTGWETVRFEPTCTNWHYLCAKALIAGKISF